MLDPIRKGRITASMIGAIAGTNKYQSRSDAMRVMVREHFGADKEFTGSIATQWGHDHEAQAIAEWAEKYQVDAEPYGRTITKDTPDFLAAATPDAGVTFGVLAEIKCPFGKRDKEVVPAEYLAENPQYYDQMVWQMYIVDADAVHFVVWTMCGVDSVLIKRDQKREAELIDIARDFWAEFQNWIADKDSCAHFLSSLEPVERDDDDFADAVAGYKLAQQALEAAQKNADDARENLLEVAGGIECRGYGISVTKSERKGSVDYKKVPELKGVNLDAYRKPASIVWTVRGEK